MADSKITSKVWNIAGVLMDAGVSNSDYLEQITFLLFLKMVDENKQMDEDFRNFNDIPLPDGYSWDILKSKSGEELKEYYGKMLAEFSKQTGIIGNIYQNAQNKIQTPNHLKKVINMIDSIEWNTLGEDVKGDIYEGLLEKIAQDTKSGAGQYFTPRALINVIVKCVNPTLGKRITDPCCGSGGFLLAAKKFLMETYNPTGKEAEDLKKSTFFGNEIVPNTYRLCLMNLLLHGIGEFGDTNLPVQCKDSLASPPSASELADYVLTNPPFGTKSLTEREKEVKDKKTGETKIKLVKDKETYNREDFVAVTSNKQLNFLQHIKTLLKVHGTAAVVLPDNVLFEDGAGALVRREILKNCNLHTILRLPTGLFYAQGVKANVLFFDKPEPDTEQTVQTKEVWIYDYRSNIKHTLKQNPLREENLSEFVECYRPNDRYNRAETYNAETNPNGRWRKFSYSEIAARPNTTLDIKWLKDGNEEDTRTLGEILQSVETGGRLVSEATAKLRNLFSGINLEE